MAREEGRTTKREFEERHEKIRFKKVEKNRSRVRAYSKVSSMLV